MTKEELWNSPQSTVFPIGPIRRMDEVANSAQLRARGFFVEIEHPEAGKLKYPSAPYQLSRTPWQARRPAPLLGQHNEEVFCNRFGYTKQDLVKFKEAGVI